MTEPNETELPPCAREMGCLCAGHARGAAASVPCDTHEQPLAVREAFSRGYDRGNYGNAYESQDWEAWYAKNSHRGTRRGGAVADAARDGMLLGFFSSYELHEIADDGGK